MTSVVASRLTTPKTIQPVEMSVSRRMATLSQSRLIQPMTLSWEEDGPLEILRNEYYLFFFSIIHLLIP
jgi:hypothetical protein